MTLGTYLEGAHWYLGDLPQSLYEYLVLVGTTGVIVAHPDDKVFPPSLCESVEKRHTREIPYFAGVTYNMLTRDCIFYPLRGQNEMDPSDLSIKTWEYPVLLLATHSFDLRRYCIPPTLYASRGVSSNPALESLNINSFNEEEAGNPILFTKITAASLYGCYKVAAARAGLLEGNYVSGIISFLLFL